MQPSNDVRITTGTNSSETPCRRHGRACRLGLWPRTFALTLLAVAWTTMLGASAPAHASAQPSVEDYCVIVHPVYVDNRQVFGGGTYCIPFPGA